MFRAAVSNFAGHEKDSLMAARPLISAEIVKGEPAVPVLVDIQALPQQRESANPVDSDFDKELDAFQSLSGYAKREVGDLNIVSRFKAIDYTQSEQGVPPNPAIMVGSQHVVVSVNGSFQVFDKGGTTLLGPILFEDFWGSNCGTGSNSMEYFYPFSSYDVLAGRYVLGVAGSDLAVNNGDNGYLCLAVSQTDSATGQWYLYNFDGNPGPGPELLLDFPRVGMGQEAIFLGATMYDEISIASNRVFAFEKAAMYAGNTAASVTADVGEPYFTIIPADMKGVNSSGRSAFPTATHFFVEAEPIGDEIRVFAFEDPWGTPSFSLAGTVAVSSYLLPNDQPQAGTSHRIMGLDTRIMEVVYRNDRLWATHTIGCNPGGGLVNCLRWYEIDVSNPSTPALLQEGTFGSSNNYRSFPAAALNVCGDVLFGYTKTSSAVFPGVYVAGRQADDPPGQLKSETELHAGEINYTDFENPPYKWGFYAGMALDPDGMTFWHVGEYARLQPDARWSTWVGAFTWAGCEPKPTPTPSPSPSATPSSTPTYTVTPTPSTMPTASPTPTGTPTLTPAATASPSPSPTLTNTPTGTATPIPSATPSVTPTEASADVYQSWIPVVMK